MRKLFIQFYLLLIVSFLIVTMLVGGIYKLTAERSSDRSLTDLMGSIMVLLERELPEIPVTEWPDKIETEDLGLSFAVRIEKIQDQPLDEESVDAINRGEIVMLEDQSICMERIRNSPYALIVGPIPYLSFQHEVRSLDYLILIFLGISMGFPVFIWMRPHWRDLLRLEQSAYHLGQGDLSTRTNLPEQSSLHRLGQAFDKMAGSIQALIASKKRLTDNVAHELRTPLVHLRYRLEMLDPPMPDEHKAGFDRDISHLESLIDEMLTYARLDHPQLLLQFQPFSPAEWIAQRAEEWQKLNEQKTLTTNTIPADWIWQGDMKLVNRLLDNLVGNGFRYCAQEVRITLSQEHDCAQIIVENDGPPIPPEQAKAIFDPFYRLDPSRDRATGGFGLGLAIVNSIIQAHQGSVHVERGQLGGAAFICRWPLQLTH